MAVSMNRLFPIRAIGPGMCLVGRDRFTAVFEAIPINFSLRSLNDQQRLVQAYTVFLNGLNFPIELLIRSDLMRLDDYLGDIKANEEEIEPHLRPVLGDYIEFIKETASVQHLLRRRFFLFLSWQGTDSRTRPLKRGEVLWHEAEIELERRKEILSQGLRPMGVRIRSLNNEELFRFIHAGLGSGQNLPTGITWAWN